VIGLCVLNQCSSCTYVTQLHILCRCLEVQFPYIASLLLKQIQEGSESITCRFSRMTIYRDMLIIDVWRGITVSHARPSLTTSVRYTIHRYHLSQCAVCKFHKHDMVECPRILKTHSRHIFPLDGVASSCNRGPFGY
jgi:hypothetical protein